jgi:surface carbohydrate biosynthesis protein
LQPVAYLPLEIKQRDLDCRLLIAAHLLASRVPVVIGQQWSLISNLQNLPPGVVLFKSVNSIMATSMKMFHRLGHLVTATDEEVLACVEDACFMESFCQQAADSCHMFFAQNELHKAAVEARFPQLRQKTMAVGNSRIDLLSPPHRPSLATDTAESAAQRPYILFNTNYGQINSIWRDMNQVRAIAVRVGWVDPDDPASVARYEAILEWERRNRDEIVPLIHWAADNLSHKIVIRPHPVELVEFWQEEFGGHANVIIIPRSAPYPWLLESDLVVHTQCTTGLETALLGNLAVNVQPLRHPLYEHAVARVNPTFSTWQAAADAMAQYLNHRTGPIVAQREACDAVLAKLFPGYETGRASRSIAKEMVRLLIGAGITAIDHRAVLPAFVGYQRHARADTLRDKFTISQEDFLLRLQQICGSLGYNIQFNIRALDDSLFIMVPKA